MRTSFNQRLKLLSLRIKVTEKMIIILKLCQLKKNSFRKMIQDVQNQLNEKRNQTNEEYN
jgi:hypothetical protein